MENGIFEERRNMENELKKQKHNYIAEMLYSKKEKYKKEDNMIYPFWSKFDELIAYYNMLCPDWDNKTYFSLLKIDENNKYRWSICRDDLVNLDITNETDFYCSINSFYAMGKQTSSYSKHLNSIIIDLDYYNIPHLKNLKPYQVIELMNMEINFPKISFYTTSGRGICLFWLLEKTYSTQKSRNFYKKILLELFKLFEPYGADPKCKDVARVIRLVGTINSKNGNRVKIVTPEHTELETYQHNPIRYELSDLAQYFWGVKEEKEKSEPKKVVKKTTKKMNNNITTLKTVKNLYYSRCKDIETLVNIRLDKPQEGIREHLLFIYRLQLLLSGIEPQKALELTLNLNSNLLDPLGDNEVIKATESAVGNAETYFRLKDKYKKEYGSLNTYLSNGGVYLYTNKTIIELLQITTEEMEHLKNLITKEIKIKNKRVKNQEYYKENQEKENNRKKEYYHAKLKEQGKLTKQEQLEVIYTKIKSLLAKGFTQKHIATELDIKLPTLKRYIKHIKDNGL